MRDFFKQTNFRHILKLLVIEEKKSDPNFSFSSLSNILGVQKTYLSKIMNEKGLLSSDQIYSLSEYFSFTKNHTEFLTLLVEYERTGLARRKKSIQDQIGAIQLQHRHPKNNLKSEFIKGFVDNAEAVYYLDPFMTIVHQHFALSEFGGDPFKIGLALGLSKPYLEKILGTLKSLGLIEPTVRNSKLYRITKNNIWLSPESPLNSAYYSLFRQISAYKLMKTPIEERHIFSITFTGDQKCKSQIHEAFIKFIRETEEFIKNSESKEVYQINFDLFPWR